MKNNILSAIQKELIEQADPKAKDGIQRYFKEKVTVYGVKTLNVSKIAEQYFKNIKHLNKRDVFTLCEELFKTGFIEESWIACEWAYKMRRAYETGDFHIFEDWISKYINNWATCDTLCNHTIGALIEMYPQYISNLKEWAKSSNRWFRRAAAVTLIIPAKQGEFLEDIFEIASTLLTDTDDLVQKGYGWMLKEASRTHKKEVFEYVLCHKKVMPRTALRYAIEKMPPDLKQRAMAK